jgi:hypothetical protein
VVADHLDVRIDQGFPAALLPAELREGQAEEVA